MAEVSESLSRPFAGSLIAHSAIVGLIAFTGFLHLKSDTWGEQHASSGSVGIDVVKSIPIPRNEGPENPLANETKSNTPQQVDEKPVKAVTKAPDPKAIELPDKVDKRKKTAPKEMAANLFKPMQYQANQVYANTPQSVSSKMYGMQGAGGIDVGPQSVLGTRFGAYATLLRDRIGQKWNTAGIHASAAKSGVTFTIARNGAISDVQLTHPSGDYLLDTSARRAVMDASPVPDLPRDFERSQATVEMWFQLKQ